MNPKQHVEIYFDEEKFQMITLDRETIEYFFRDGFMDEIIAKTENLKKNGFDKKTFIREHDVSVSLMNDLGQSKMSARKFLK